MFEFFNYFGFWIFSTWNHNHHNEETKKRRGEIGEIKKKKSIVRFVATNQGHEKLKVESAHAGCMIVTPQKIIVFDQAYTPKYGF